MRAGETIEGLARAYHVPVEDLLELNDLDPGAPLAAGRELFVPRARARPPARGPAPRWRWPVDGGLLSSRFGPRWGRAHEGIDISAPEGTAVRAAAGGRVLFSGSARGYGNLVVLAHDGVWASVYAHNRENRVRDGERVRAGQEIARVGTTGRSTGPHLHFEVRCGPDPRDPLEFVRPP